MGSAVWKKGVRRRCWRSTEGRRAPDQGSGAPTGIDKSPDLRRSAESGGGVRSAEFNIGATNQTEVHWWELWSSHPKLRGMEWGE